MSKQLTIKARAPKIGKEIEFPVTVGETGAESIEMFGDEAVNSNACANFSVYAQGVARRMMIQEKSDEEIIQVCSDLKMGVSLPRGTGDSKATIKAKFSKLFNEMPAEEKKAFLAELKKGQ